MAVIERMVERTNEERGRPAERFARIIKYLRVCCSLLGMDVTSGHYRINAITVLVLSDIISYSIFSITTMIGQLEQGWGVVLQTNCFIGNNIQGFVKIIYHILYADDLYALRTNLESLYWRLQSKGGEYALALEESCNRLKKSIIGLGAMYSMTCSLLVFWKIVEVLWTGERTLLLPYTIPGTNATTDIGFLLNTGMHSWGIFVLTFGLFASDAFIILFFTQGTLFVRILKLHVDDLNAECRRVHSSEQVTENVYRHFKEIIRWHQLYIRYIEACIKVYDITLSAQVAGASFSIVCTVFVLLTTNWPVAYVCVVMVTNSLYMYCILGTIFETNDERFCRELCNIHWYHLPEESRRLMPFVIARSLKGNRILIFGSNSLSVSTAYNITKTIYSIIMMMLKFLK